MSARVKPVVSLLVVVVLVAVTQTLTVQRGLADATGSDGHGTVKVAASTAGSGTGYPRRHFAGDGYGTGTCSYEPAPPYVQQTFGNGGPIPGQWLLFGCPGFDFGLSNSEGTAWMHVVWVTYAAPRVAVGGNDPPRTACGVVDRVADPIDTHRSAWDDLRQSFDLVLGVA